MTDSTNILRQLGDDMARIFSPPEHNGTREWLRLMADMATGRDEPEPHRQREDAK